MDRDPVTTVKIPIWQARRALKERALQRGAARLVKAHANVASLRTDDQDTTIMVVGPNKDAKGCFCGLLPVSSAKGKDDNGKHTGLRLRTHSDFPLLLCVAGEFENKTELFGQDANNVPCELPPLTEASDSLATIDAILEHRA